MTHKSGHIIVDRVQEDVHRMCRNFDDMTPRQCRATLRKIRADVDDLAEEIENEPADE